MHRDIFGILLARGTDISSGGSTVQRSERVMDYGQSCIDKVRAKPKRMPLKQRVAVPPDRLVTKRRFHDFSRLQGRDEEMKAMTIRLLEDGRFLIRNMSQEKGQNKSSNAIIGATCNMVQR